MIAKQCHNLEVAHPTGFEPVTSAFGSKQLKLCSSSYCLPQQFEMAAAILNRQSFQNRMRQARHFHAIASLRPQVMMVACSRNQIRRENSSKFNVCWGFSSC
jgi:hypothetical protein